MVLSNKKLKQKLRASLAESLAASVSGADPKIASESINPEPDRQQPSLKELLDSATQKPRLSKRDKRRKIHTLEGEVTVKSSRNDENTEEKKDVEERNEGGEEGLSEKRKKRKIEEGVESGGVEKKPKSSKKKKKKKVKSEEEEKKSGEQGAVEANSQVTEDVATKVYVGGIPYYSTEEDIRSFFEGCGTITEVDCMKFPESGKFRGIAIINFKTEAAAKRALAYDGADMGGLYLKVQPFKTTRAKKTSDFAPEILEGYNRIYIGNLSWDITEDELKNFFADCNISSLRFGMDKETGEFRGYAHVEFSNSLSLIMALKLDQEIVCGRPVRIRCAVPKKGAKSLSTSSLPTSNGAENAGSTSSLPESNAGENAGSTTSLPKSNGAQNAGSTSLPTSNGAQNAEMGTSSGKMKRRTCYECGEKGHISSACPKKQAADATNQAQVE